MGVKRTGSTRQIDIQALDSFGRNKYEGKCKKKLIQAGAELDQAQSQLGLMLKFIVHNCGEITTSQ